MSPHRSRARGFTLLEMLIVLAILSALATMAWPSLRRDLDRRQLRAAAKQVRTELAAARNLAVATGRIVEFRYEIGGNRFRRATIALPVLRDAGAAASEPASDSAGPPGERGAEPSTGHEGVLPEGTRFLPADREAPELTDRGAPEHRWAGRGAGPPEASAGVRAGGDGGGSGPAGDDRSWSPPIRFFPNGQTSSGSIRVGNERGAVVDLALRPLTGLATLGPLRRTKATR